MAKRKRRATAKLGARALIGPMTVTALKPGSRAAKRKASPRQRLGGRPVLLAVGAVLVTVFAIKEYPALHREIKIWMM